MLYGKVLKKDVFGKDVCCGDAVMCIYCDGRHKYTSTGIIIGSTKTERLRLISSTYAVRLNNNGEFINIKNNIKEKAAVWNTSLSALVLIDSLDLARETYINDYLKSEDTETTFYKILSKNLTSAQKKNSGINMCYLQE